MQTTTLGQLNLDAYGDKGAGPIILALAFVIVMGGAVAAAIVVCGGWGKVKSMHMNWASRRLEVVCR